MAHARFSLVLLAAACCLGPPPSARAAIVTTGNVEPTTDPATWTGYTDASIGKTSEGSVSVDLGSDLLSQAAYLGYNAGSNGRASVSGFGSTWANRDNLLVGNRGSGTLNIEAGAEVSNLFGFVAYWSRSSGTVRIAGAGSKWTNTAALCVGRQGSGILDIEAGARVSNIAGELGQMTGSHDAATVTGPDSKWTNSGNLTIGGNGSGTLTLNNGAMVTNQYGYLAYSPGTIGTATITGAGSKWTNSAAIFAGCDGSGALYIEDGGEVANTAGYLGYWSGSGRATVNGTGSKWTNSSTLYVGNSGRGTLTLANGGAVTAQSVSVNSQSLVAIDVGNDSRLTINNGTGTITNSGKIRLIAGARVSAGAPYNPILAGNYGNAANYQAVGGTWDATAHTFTPSVVQAGAGGASMELDLATQQRAMVTDGSTGWTLGESFLVKAATLNVTTTAISGTTRTGVEQAIAVNQSLRGGWQFMTDGGYAASDPAYLSFDLGAGYSRSALSVWKYNGTVWASYDAFDLTYDGRYASFTVTDLNTAGYAMAGTLTRTWTGGATGDDWAQGANWNNGVGMMPTDILVFEGSTRLTPNNDVAGRQVAGLKFAAGAGEFHLGGNKLKLAGKIDDQAAAKQEIYLPVEFVAGPESGLVNVVSGGELKLSQPVGGNQGLTKTDAGKLELLQDTEYTGNTDVQAGTLVVQGLSNGGSTTVSGTLVADYVRQDVLTINAGGKVEIDGAGTSVVNFLSIANGSGGFSWETAIGEGIRLPQSAASHNSEPVPEPAAWWLCASAAGMLLWRWRSRYGRPYRACPGSEADWPAKGELPAHTTLPGLSR